MLKITRLGRKPYTGPPSTTCRTTETNKIKKPTDWSEHDKVYKCIVCGCLTPLGERCEYDK